MCIWDKMKYCSKYCNNFKKDSIKTMKPQVILIQCQKMLDPTPSYDFEKIPSLKNFENVRIPDKTIASSVENPVKYFSKVAQLCSVNWAFYLRIIHATSQWTCGEGYYCNCHRWASLTYKFIGFKNTKKKLKFSAAK